MSDLLSDDINDFCFIDTETKSLSWTAGTVDESVTSCGVYRYRRCASVIMIQYAIGDAPQRTLSFSDFDVTRKFIWERGFMPDDLMDFYERAQRGEAWFAAWNAAFDRLMLNTVDGHKTVVENWIDVMGQAMASNLPAKLDGAGKSLHIGGKQEDGKDLITMFCGANGWHTADGLAWGGEGASPQSRPEEWARFCSYGGRDIDQLRGVFKATRPLPRREWQSYWTSEKINDRGMPVDVDFCDKAAAIAELNSAQLADICRRLTGGVVTKVTQAKRIGEWLYDRLPSVEARDLLVKAWADEDTVTGADDELVPAKLSIAEDRLIAVLNWFDHWEEQNDGLTDQELELLELIEARTFGASAAPLKFQKIVDYNDDGWLRGQYVWSGAQQTGRFSSRLVQVHNLVRASLTDKEHPGREVEAIEDINDLEITYA